MNSVFNQRKTQFLSKSAFEFHLEKSEVCAKKIESRNQLVVSDVIRNLNIIKQSKTSITLTIKFLFSLSVVFLAFPWDFSRSFVIMDTFRQIGSGLLSKMLFDVGSTANSKNVLFFKDRWWTRFIKLCPATLISRFFLWWQQITSFRLRFLPVIK